MGFDKLLNIIKLGRLVIHSTFLIFLLGTLFAITLGANFDVYKFIFGYAIVFTAILATSYSNNYYDVDTDNYSTGTPFSGGSKILIEHPELLRLTKHLSIGLYILSILLGFIFIVVYSFPITFFILVILGNVLGWFYTTPPFKLLYRGLGEISTMIAVGFFMPGTGYFVVMGHIDSSFFAIAIPFLFYGLAASLNIEIPDINADRRANKKTIIVRKGPFFGFILTVLLLFLATLSFFVIAQLSLIPGDINFWLISLTSIIPLSFSIRNLVKHNADQRFPTKLVISNIVSMFFFYILLTSYFFFLILS